MNDIKPDPADPVERQALARFEQDFAQANSLEHDDASLMALATSDASGQPSVRTVNFVGMVQGGFSFFVNATSGKGMQLATNPLVALCFYWPRTNLQVVIEGKAEPLAAAQSDELWKSRPRSSALMAWASHQSFESAGLDQRYVDTKQHFDDLRVARPDQWVAYATHAHRIEFWGGGWQARRERDSYQKTADGWCHQQLNP